MTVGNRHVESRSPTSTILLSPALQFFAKLVLVVFLAEAVVMLFLRAPLDGVTLGQLLISLDGSGLIEALFDSSLLVALSAPAIYYWIFDPYVAKRRSAEKALRDSEEQFRNLIAGSIQGVLIHCGSKVLFTNQALADIFGYEDPGELLALPTVDVLEAEHERERLEAYSTARLNCGSAPERYEFEGVRKDGSAIWLENFVTMVEWNGERAVQSTTVNITERKRAERALQESEQVLQQRVLELEVVRDQLQRQGSELVELAESLHTARSQAELANHSKSEFLANMSHELRTPLNAIIGFSEIIRNETFGPVGSTKYREYGGDIHGAGHHLLDLINDILDLSKIEAGREELHEGEIEIPELIRSVVALVKGRAEKSDVRLVVDLPDGLPMLRADERKMKQILVNILSNAIKFTEAGGSVTLKIWCRPGRGHVFRIADTGIGMALEDIPKALMAFGQIDSELSRKYEGTGLGLPLTKHLVEMHSGSLDLQSAKGVGTTVTVRLPAERIVTTETVLQADSA